MKKDVAEKMCLKINGIKKGGGIMYTNIKNPIRASLMKYRS